MLEIKSTAYQLFYIKNTLKILPDNVSEEESQFKLDINK